MLVRRIGASIIAVAVTAAGLMGAGAQPALAAPTPGSTLSIYAGNGSYSSIIPGPALSSPMYYPQLLAADGLGNLFVAFESSTSNRRAVAKIDVNGTVSYLLNSSNTYGTPAVGGAALTSPFGDVTGLAADAAGNVYVSNANTYSIYKIDTAGQLNLLAGTGTRSTPGALLGPGSPTTTDIKPSMLGVSSDGSTVYFLDDRARRIGRISGGTLTTVAGNGSSGAPTPGTSGSPVLAVNSPISGGTYDGLAVDSSGDLFMVGTNCVTMIAPSTGELTSVAGTCGTPGAPTPGPAAASLLNGVREIAVDRYDDLYIADRSSFRIVKVTDPDSGAGTLSYVAGDGVNGATTAGPATSVHIRGMNGLAVTRRMDVMMGEDYGTYIARVAGTPSVPDAPTGLTATSGSSSATVSFTPPVEDGGSNITAYEYTTDAGGTWTPLTTSGSGPVTATVTGLANGTTYTLAVRAVNTVGGSAGSGTASVTPQAPPPPLPPPPSPPDLTSTGTGTQVQSVATALTSGQTVTLLDGATPADVVTDAQAGTYRLTPGTGAISFTPALGFSGTSAGVTYRVTDSLGRSGTGLYVPTVMKPPAPSPVPITSSGTGAQSVTVGLGTGQTLTLLDGAGHPAAAVRVAGQGTYATGTAGMIGFIPVSGFTGQASAVTFRVTDAYQQHGDASYTATVKAVSPSPLPPIDRSGLAPIPANPKKITGPERRTKAFNSSFAGIDAYPIPRLGTRLLRRGQATTLSGDGLFEFDRARLTAKGRHEVKLAVTNLAAADGVRCEGYTDYAGELSHELDLSLRRARAVCTALKQYGATVTTTTKGYGPKRPAVVGGSAKTRKENRRVVIVITR